MIRHVLKRWNANKPSRWSMACAGAAAAMMVPALTAQAQQLLDDAWVATWGSSPSFVQSTAYIGTQQVNNQTIRQIGRVSLGGNRVRIRGGSLDGMEGILVRQGRDQSLVVSVELLCRSVSIRVEGYDIESI